MSPEQIERMKSMAQNNMGGMGFPPQNNTNNLNRSQSYQPPPSQTPIHQIKDEDIDKANKIKEEANKLYKE